LLAGREMSGFLGTVDHIPDPPDFEDVVAWAGGVAEVSDAGWMREPLPEASQLGCAVAVRAS
jgi:hypothetical protein